MTNQSKDPAVTQDEIQTWAQQRAIESVRTHRRDEAVRQINAAFIELVDATTHDAVRQRLLQIHVRCDRLCVCAAGRNGVR